MLNRGNCKMEIFGKEGDFAAFLKLLEEGRKRYGMRILGYCLMGNHWHLVLWPRKGEDLSKFIGWVCTTHVRRWREHRGNVGEGHLYQGRFKSFLVQEDRHFLMVMRYVEGNALRAGIVKRAEEWRWSSLDEGTGGVELAEWPVDRPGGWKGIVNREMEEKAVERIQMSVRRGRPFGEAGWVERVVRKFGLEGTMREPWRPKKK